MSIGMGGGRRSSGRRAPGSGGAGKTVETSLGFMAGRVLPKERGDTGYGFIPDGLEKACPWFALSAELRGEGWDGVHRTNGHGDEEP